MNGTEELAPLVYYLSRQILTFGKVKSLRAGSLQISSNMKIKEGEFELEEKLNFVAWILSIGFVHRVPFFN